jgi:hypothetical protein
MEVNKLEIALVKEACPLCGASIDGPIVMNSVLTEKHAASVKEMHGKVVRIAKEPCAQCKDHMKQGFLLIGADEKLTKDKSNPHRSGNIWVISQEKATELFSDVSKGAAFISLEAAECIGLPLDSNSNDR